VRCPPKKKNSLLIAAAEICGFTRAELAAAAEISITAVDRAAKGLPIRPATADALARALGMGSREIRSYGVVVVKDWSRKEDR
jgi:hypothetical protein